MQLPKFVRKLKRAPELLAALPELFAALRSISPYQNCFELAARGRDADALELVGRTRAVTRSNRLTPWDVDLQLLEAYLLFNQGSFQQAQSTLRGVFSRIKASTDHNEDERAVLIRYGVSVLWLARGRVEPSCLLIIRQHHTFDISKVREAVLNHFPNPDEAP